MSGQDETSLDELRRRLEALAGENAQLRAALGAAERAHAATHRFLDTAAFAITYMRRDGTISTINEAGARNLGGVPAQLQGNSIYQLVPALADQTRQRIEQTLDSGEPLMVETRVTLPVGERWFRSTYHPVLDADGVPELVQLVSQDVTELKRMEQVLQATEGRLASILEHAPQIVAVVDTDGVIRYINRVPEGYRADQVVGSKSTEYLPPQHAEPFTASFRRVLETGQPQLVELDGVSGAHWEIRMAPIMKAGRVHQVLTFAVDISERCRAQQRELELETQVQHAQKLESLGVLAGGIAHDFNNLLVGVLGNAQLALCDPTPAAASEHLQCIIEAARRAAELCQQMLAYAGRGQLSLAPLDVAKLARGILELVRPSITKRARVLSECPWDLPPVEGDATQLRQVVMNLLTNASDALGEREGEIALRCGVTHVRVQDRPGGYLPERPAAGAYVYIEVRDTGCGMDAETRSRMFDPFFTSKQLGSGLGLAATLGIVRRHRGAVHVDSEPGSGTTVRVLLPEAPRSEIRADEPRRAINVAARTVLVVDDEPMVRRVAKQMLERAGHRVLLAADGLEALEVHDAERDNIDAVLLDLSMPRMDGRETLQRLRERDAQLPIVVASGYHARGDGLTRDGDPTCFIAKPYDHEALLAALQRALAGASR